MLLLYQQHYTHTSQLCAGASDKERSKWHLGKATDFVLLNQSGCCQLPSMDDAQEYMVRRNIFRCVGHDEAGCAKYSSSHS